MRYPKRGNYGLVIFWRFLNFGPCFGQFWGTVVKNIKKLCLVLISIFVISQTILVSIFKSLNCVFPKCTFLNSLKALALLGRPAGLKNDNIEFELLSIAFSTRQYFSVFKLQKNAFFFNTYQLFDNAQF